MADSQNKNIFRKTTLERISSPEQLTDYLRVTNPGIWAILTAVILLLAGIFAWSMVGTLETKSDVRVVVTENMAQVIPGGSEKLAEGMPLRVSGQEYRIDNTQTDEYGRVVGSAQVDLPDGTYDGTVVTETVHAISFLLESR